MFYHRDRIYNQHLCLKIKANESSIRSTIYIPLPFSALQSVNISKAHQRFLLRFPAHSPEQTSKCLLTDLHNCLLAPAHHPADLSHLYQSRASSRLTSNRKYSAINISTVEVISQTHGTNYIVGFLDGSPNLIRQQPTCSHWQGDAMRYAAAKERDPISQPAAGSPNQSRYLVHVALQITALQVRVAP